MSSVTRLGALTLLLLRGAIAQTPPDVAAILKKVGQTYMAASQYEITGDGVAHEPRTNEAVPLHMFFAFRSPDRYRLEGTVPGGHLPVDGTIVDDGSAVWLYLPKLKQYGSIPASALDKPDSGDLSDLRPASMNAFVIGRYRGAAQFAPAAILLREEAIEFGGSKVECFVLSIAARQENAAFTWWVDAKRYLVLREDRKDSSFLFKTIKLGEALPNELFKYEPPPGAGKLELQH